MSSSKQSEKKSPAQQPSQTERETSADERVPVPSLAVRKGGEEFVPKQVVRGENEGEEGERAVEVKGKGKGDVRAGEEGGALVRRKGKRKGKGKGKGKGKEESGAQRAVQVEGKGEGEGGGQAIERTAKGKEREQPRPRDPVQAEPKGKRVEHPVPANIKGKKAEEPRPQPPVQAEPKGKQIEQPIQASRKSKQPQQAPPELSKPATVVKCKQPQRLTIGQRLQNRPTLQRPPRKTILANSNHAYLGSQDVFIARIPAKRSTKRSTMYPVKVSIIADSLYSHPQTFFFKNLPDVECYWGALNDAATTARRIVRLETGGQPMPYFLLASRGEWPKATSPRNDSVIFAGMHVPIFGDAFVFKLAYVELDENGYARYTNVEDDIASIDWLPEAIREAARKVDNATAAEANPGFPDMEKYADAKPWRKDGQETLRHRNPIRKVARKHGSDLPVDARAGLPGAEMIDVIKEMTNQVDHWKNEGVLLIDRGPESSDFRTVMDFKGKALDALYAIRDDTDDTRSLNGASSASPSLGSPDVNTTAAVDKVKDCFRATRDAFDQVKAVTRMNVARSVIKTMTVDEMSKAIDVSDLKYGIDALLMSVFEWKRCGAFSAHVQSGSLDQKIVDDFVEKVQVAYRAMELPINESKLYSAIKEINDAFAFVKVEIDKQKALPEVKVAKKADAARKADATRTSNTSPELPDLPGYPGTSRHRVERFD